MARVPSSAPRPCDTDFALLQDLSSVLGIDQVNRGVWCFFRTEHCSGRATAFVPAALSLRCEMHEVPSGLFFSFFTAQRGGGGSC